MEKFSIGTNLKQGCCRFVTNQLPRRGALSHLFNKVWLGWYTHVESHFLTIVESNQNSMDKLIMV